MIPVLKSDRASLLLGDAAHVDTILALDSVDALVTDPPAGIGFMGKGWDSDKGGREAWIKWFAETIGAAFRVLKPGAHGLVWALPRTSHWTATALEDAGFEIRDIHHHLFGTGFPKSLNIGDGRGTALKPAAEHWILVRKPLVGTVAANVLTHGTGALNIDACRIEGDKAQRGERSTALGSMNDDAWRPRTVQAADHLGRWPAHVSLDEEAAAVLDEQSGASRSTGGRKGGTIGASGVYGDFAPMERANAGGLGDYGGASRFFYVAKPSKRERNAGCENLPDAKNFHPTVKSQALMRWLIRLITPPGGLVLDPFAGSCSTGVAAVAEGMSFIGVEQDQTYVEIARARLENAIDDAKSKENP